MILFQLSDKFLFHIVIDVTIAGESCGTGSSGAEGSGDVPQYKRSGSDALLRAHGGERNGAKRNR